MDQLICASLSHTHYWYEVGILRVTPAGTSRSQTSRINGKITHTHTHTHTHRKERVGSVAANSDNLGSNKEAGGGAQGAQDSSEICTSRESVSRLIRGFRNKYHRSPLGRINASGIE